MISSYNSPLKFSFNPINKLCVWSELPDFICETTEAQILWFAQSSMETKAQNVDYKLIAHAA